MAKRNWYSKPTQVYRTCHALLSGRTIFHRTEIREVNGWRLGAIIHRLRHDFGWPIETNYRGPENVAYYRLITGTKREALRFPKSAEALAAPEVQA